MINLFKKKNGVKLILNEKNMSVLEVYLTFIIGHAEKQIKL